MRWEEIAEKNFQSYMESMGVYYRLSKGKERGIPTCRGCKRPFRDKNEWRITTKLQYTRAEGMWARRVDINLCINSSSDKDKKKGTECITTAMENYQRRVNYIHIHIDIHILFTIYPIYLAINTLILMIFFQFSRSYFPLLNQSYVYI